MTSLGESIRADSPTRCAVYPTPAPGRREEQAILLLRAQCLLAALADFLDGLTPGAPLLVAFSGGPDSCALLWGLHRLAPGRGFPLHAAHYDHRLDPDSPGRAERAALLCSALRVPLRRGAALEPGRGGGLGPEAEARRGRSIMRAA